MGTTPEVLVWQRHKGQRHKGQRPAGSWMRASGHFKITSPESFAAAFDFDSSPEAQTVPTRRVQMQGEINHAGWVSLNPFASKTLITVICRHPIVVHCAVKFPEVGEQSIGIVAEHHGGRRVHPVPLYEVM